MIYYIKFVLFAITLVFLFAVFEADRFINANRNVKFLEETSLSSFSSDFTISQLLGELFVRLVFNIIYKKVETGNYFKSKFRITYMLTNYLCIISLGVSKNGIKLIYLLIKHRSYKSVVDFLASLLIIRGKTRRVFFINGVWKLNGRLYFKILHEFKIKKFSNLQTKAVADTVKNYEDTYLNGFLCETVIGQHTSINSKTDHFFTKSIVRDNQVLGFFSDEAKAKLADFYKKPIFLKGIELNKTTSMLEASLDDFYAKRSGRLIHSEKLIKAAIRWGYDPVKFTDQFNDEVYKNKLIFEDIEIVLMNRDLFNENEAKEARKIIYNIDFFS